METTATRIRRLATHLNGLASDLEVGTKETITTLRTLEVYEADLRAIKASLNIPLREQA
ncbi:MAG: hypothetical protein VW338_14575 [Rhodospirillaceae bacterium]